MNKIIGNLLENAVPIVTRSINQNNVITLPKAWVDEVGADSVTIYRKPGSNDLIIVPVQKA